MAKTVEKRIAEIISSEVNWSTNVLKGSKSELKKGKTTEKLVEQLQDRIETASEKWFDQFFNGDQELVVSQIDNAVKANLDDMLKEAVKSATVGSQRKLYWLGMLGQRRIHTAMITTLK